MMRRTVVAIIALAAGLLIAGPSQATPAQEYQGACALGVTKLNPHPGDTLAITGNNFPLIPDSVPIVIDNPSQQIGTAHVDASGHFSDHATLPSNLSGGAHTISVACASSGVDATTSINVLAANITQSSSSPLARTGDDTEPIVLAGLGAVAVGMALVLTARRRRAQRLAV